MISKSIPTIKKHFKITQKEYIDIMLATLILSFIFSFSKWGKNITYAIHIILIGIIVLCSLLLHIGIQKAMGIYYGYKSEFQVSIISLLAALMIGILTDIQSKGLILVLVIPGTIVYKIMSKHRIGKWPKGPNFPEMGLITSFGILLNLCLAVIFYGLYNLTGVWFFWLITIINSFFALGTILPLPKNDGLLILYSSRIGYVLISCLVITTSFLIISKLSFLLTLLLTIITLLLVWFGYYHFIERALGS